MRAKDFAKYSDAAGGPLKSDLDVGTIRRVTAGIVDVAAKGGGTWWCVKTFTSTRAVAQRICDGSVCVLLSLFLSPLFLATAC